MHHAPSQSGFSLIELLISLTIFTVVITMSTGTLLVLINSNAKAQNMQAVMNNLTFALDSMTREIRTGTNYVCDSVASAPSGVDDPDDVQDCVNGGNYISVVESGNSLTSGLSSPRISYYYDDDYYGAHGAILRKLADENWFPLTAETVRITDAEFVVTGTPRGDAVQPTITMYIEGEAGELSGLDSGFNMQASVTQRLIDL